MSMTITFGTTSSPKNALTKTYTSSVSLTGNLKDDTSVVDPIIVVNASLSTLAGCNYMYIATFGRYYFITDIVSKGASLVEVHGHCDVLKSFASQIRNCTGYVSRQATSGNDLITDDMKALTNKPTVTTYQTSGGTAFNAKTNAGIVLTVACSTSPTTPSAHSS